MTIADLREFINNESELEEDTQVNMEIHHDYRTKTHRVTGYNINKIELRILKTETDTKKVICLIHSEEAKT